MTEGVELRFGDVEAFRTQIVEQDGSHSDPSAWTSSPPAIGSLMASVPDLAAALATGRVVRVLGPESLLKGLDSKQLHLLGNTGTVASPDGKIVGQLRLGDPPTKTATVAASTFHVLSAATMQYYLHSINESLSAIAELMGEVISRQQSETAARMRQAARYVDSVIRDLVEGRSTPEVQRHQLIEAQSLSGQAFDAALTELQRVRDLWGPLPEAAAPLIDFQRAAAARRSARKEGDKSVSAPAIPGGGRALRRSLKSACEPLGRAALDLETALMSAVVYARASSLLSSFDQVESSTGERRAADEFTGMIGSLRAALGPIHEFVGLDQDLLGRYFVHDGFLEKASGRVAVFDDSAHKLLAQLPDMGIDPIVPRWFEVVDHKGELRMRQGVIELVA